MNPILKVLLIASIVFLSSSCFAQMNRIKSELIFITNEITGESVQINSSVNELKKFGTLVSKDSVNPIHFTQDVVVKYVYSNIVFDVSSRSNISTFKTRSNEITLEAKGIFSFSPDDHISKIAEVFPFEAAEARLIKIGKDMKSYLCVTIYISFFSEYEKKYVDDYYTGYSLLFNPETNILEGIEHWIAP